MMTLKKTPQTTMMIMIMNKFQPALSQAGLLLTLIPVSYNLNQHLEHVCCKKQQKTRLKRFESKIAHKYSSKFKSINAPKNVNSANALKTFKFC